MSVTNIDLRDALIALCAGRVGSASPTKTCSQPEDPLSNLQSPNLNNSYLPHDYLDSPLADRIKSQTHLDNFHLRRLLFQSSLPLEFRDPIEREIKQSIHKKNTTHWQTKGTIQLACQIRAQESDLHLLTYENRGENCTTESEAADTNVRMESEDKIENVQLAIQQLIEKKTKKKAESSDADDDKEEDEEVLLLSKLFSQLESVKEDTKRKNLVSSNLDINDETQEASDGGCNKEKEKGTDEIVKEIRRVKKQNSITHWLLSILIVVTAAWQLSEVSLILKVKHSVTNPFQSLTNMMKGVLNVGRPKLLKDIEKDKSVDIEPHLPALRMPELPHMDLQTSKDFDSGED